jgi:hypothetical protein
LAEVLAVAVVGPKVYQQLGLLAAGEAEVLDPGKCSIMSGCLALGTNASDTVRVPHCPDVTHTVQHFVCFCFF